MTRIEQSLFLLLLAVWMVALLQLFGLLPAMATLNLSFYSLYSVAAVSGWLAGNVFVRRVRGQHPELRRWFLAAYMSCPPGVLILLRSLAPPEAQAAAPLVPLLAVAIYCIFFLVPVTLRRVATAPEDRR
ncbi:MAG: hypothetical protein AAF604_08300 [Acidobacteriota bacterium]